MGKKKAPFYRVVAADSRFPRDGRDIEVIGTYDPKMSQDAIVIDEEKALKWLNQGAIPTDTVRNILSNAGIMKKFSENKKSK